MLLIPPKKSAGASAMVRWRERAVRRGRRVPRSPRDPEISDVVSVLWKWVSMFFMLVMVGVLVFEVVIVRWCCWFS